MRFVLYNIRYGTGGKFKLPWSGYFRRTTSNLADISNFLSRQKPDIVGLVEVDAGSYRSHKVNQAEALAASLGHYHTYKSKYATSSWPHLLPVLNQQGNAFLTSDVIRNTSFHYFQHGLKRLVIELETENLTIFLVHLALNFRIRHHQLNDLYELVNATTKPHIVAGDFNAFWGDREIGLFLAATGLTSANTLNIPTFPSVSPHRQLDFILYSKEIHKQRLQVPRVTYSDHLPMVLDFNVD